MVIKFCILVVDIVVFVCASMNRVGQERLAMVIKLFNFLRLLMIKYLFIIYYYYYYFVVFKLF